MVIPTRRKSMEDNNEMMPPPKTPFKKPRHSEATAETCWTTESEETNEEGFGEGLDEQYEDTLVSDYEASPHPNATTPSNNNDNAPQSEENVEETEEEDLDWEKLAEHEPTRKDLEIFNAAQQRKRAADERFASAMDECHKALQASITGFLETVGVMYSLQSDELDAIEADIKQHLVSNDELRAKMQTRLEESANAAQGLFQQLLQRVAMPLQNMTNSISAVQSNGGGGAMDQADATRHEDDTNDE